MLMTMQQVLDQQPRLQISGFDVFDARFKTPEQRKRALAEGRAAMLEPGALAQFGAACSWLQQWPKLKQIKRPGTSYGLKHVAERDIGYVTNGTFIAAAIAEGFIVKRQSDGPNAYFNISARAWRR